MSKRIVALIAVLGLMGSGCTYMLRADGGTGSDAPRAYGVVLSHDARWVAFGSNSKDLGVESGGWDLFLRDTRTGTIEHLTQGAASFNAPDVAIPIAVSADGDRVLFDRTRAETAGDPDTYRGDVCIWTRGSGITVVSRDLNGGAPDGDSGAVAMSDDGDTVLFDSGATDLVAGDTNAQWDGFVRHVTAGTTQRVTLTVAGTQIPHAAGAETYSEDLSADGDRVLFTTNQPMSVADTNGHFDVYARDLGSGITTRVSVADDESQIADDVAAVHDAMTPDGDLVVLTRTAADFTRSVWLRDVGGGTTTKVDPLPTDVGADPDSVGQGISDDGRFVVASTTVTNSVTGNSVNHVVLRDRTNGRRLVVSADPQGHPLSFVGSDPRLSGDGRYVAFDLADAAVPWDTNQQFDVYLRATIQPIIDTTTPGAPSYAPGSDGTVEVTGAYFLADVVADLGAGITVTGVDRVGDTQATVHFHVGAGATAGPHDLVLVDPGTGPGGIGGAGRATAAVTIAS